MVLDAVNLDVENFLAWSLFILLIIIMVEVVRQREGEGS